ncbi:MAG: hypothetical protein KDC92_07840 [Bacteroidetes bacterium]|nr:hypothetical protein [Bacteroidota bacterium]
MRVLTVAIVFALGGCAMDTESPNSPNSTGKAGSLARYAIGGPNLNYLYSVTSTDILVTDITNLENPQLVNEIKIDEWWQAETIFPFGDYLFLGTEAGMLVYSIALDASNPVYVSSFEHIRGCDPVVAQNNLAFVTLNGNGPCGAAQNELHVLDISNIEFPRLLYTVELDDPYGLGIDGDLLFICDGKSGLKVFDASNAQNKVELLETFSNVQATDVIPYNGNLLMIGEDGFYQYHYADGNISLLSKMEVAKKG